MKPASLFLVFIALLLGCGGGDQQNEGGGRRGGPITVKVAEAQVKPVVFYNKYPATVTALDQVDVRPQVSGYVTRVHFKEGEPVRRGQRLYTIDVRRYAADLDQARSQVKTAEANLRLAEKNAERYRRLADAEAIALQTLDRAEAELEARRQDVETAKAGVTSAETQLDYTVIRAPLSGMTSLNSVKPGTQVSPGQPLLTTISSEQPIGVDFALPQESIPRLARIEREGRTADSTFRLLLPGGEVYGDFGEVYASGRSVDPRTGTLQVRLSYDNPDGMLRNGMSLEVEMLNLQSGEQLVIPVRALGEQMGEYYVFTVQDTVAHRRKVRTGQRFRDEIVILDGLTAGRQVIVEGLAAVKDSATVKIVSK